jgi:dCTP deaminase
MPLNYTEICELIEQGIIENADFKNVNSSSLDITLGREVFVETAYMQWPVTGAEIWMNPISLRDRTPLNTERKPTPYTLCPGEFILASSKEVFHLPNDISAEYKLKSSMARIALEHLNAGWCDAGWNGSVLTLELKNMTRFHKILIQEGDLIGQIVFFRHKEVPADKSYATRGRYNGDRIAQGVKK